MPRVSAAAAGRSWRGRTHLGSLGLLGLEVQAQLGGVGALLPQLGRLGRRGARRGARLVALRLEPGTPHLDRLQPLQLVLHRAQPLRGAVRGLQLEAQLINLAVGRAQLRRHVVVQRQRLVQVVLGLGQRPPERTHLASRASG